MAHNGELRRGTWRVGGRFEGTGLCSTCAGPLVMEAMVTLEPCEHAYGYGCFYEAMWWREESGDIRCPACYVSIHSARLYPSGKVVYVNTGLFPPTIVPRDPLKAPQ